jgi:5'-nucleotidase
MLILLTNDDGIRAEGLQHLRCSLEAIAEVTVVAPERERSAAGHGITMHKPLRVNKVLLGSKTFGLSVSGTPADCVKLALDKLMPKKPDLVISGINNGLNLGTDVLYSGTVSAALEAVIANIPALAVSVAAGASHEDFAYAASFVKDLVQDIGPANFPINTLLNVNIPRTSEGPVTGVKVTSQGVRKYENSVEVRKDPRGKEYYWLCGEAVKLDTSPASDLAALEQRAISLTPLQADLTNYNSMELLKKWQVKF